MRLYFTISLLIGYCLVTGQTPKRKEIHQFYKATIESIKSADTIAFLNLYWQPEYLPIVRNGFNIDSIAYDQRRRIDFKNICTNWGPYINDLDFDVERRRKEKWFEKNLEYSHEEFGYEFLICMWSKAKSKTNPKILHVYLLAANFKYCNGKLYSFGVFPDNVPDDILVQTNSD